MSHTGSDLAFFLFYEPACNLGSPKVWRGCSAQWLHESCSQLEVGPRFKKSPEWSFFLCWPIVPSSSVLSCSEHLDPDMGYYISEYNIPQDFYTEFQKTIYNGNIFFFTFFYFFFTFLLKSAKYSVQVKAQYDFTSHFIKPSATFWIYDALCIVLMSSDCCWTWHICNKKKSDHMFLSQKIGSIGPPSTFSGAAVAQVDPVVQPLPTHPTSQWFRPFRSSRVEPMRQSWQVEKSPSVSQKRRRGGRGGSGGCGGSVGCLYDSLRWQTGWRGDEWHHPESNLAKRTPIRRRRLGLSNNTDSRIVGWWMRSVTPM